MPQQLLTPDEAIDFLRQRFLGRLATVGADGPYITPLHYVFDSGRLYFHCAREGKKLDNIRSNPRVCFEVSEVDKPVFSARACGYGTRYTSVLVFGVAALMPEGERKAEILNLLVDRQAEGRLYQPVDAAMAKLCEVVEIVPETISGKRNIDAL